MSYKDLEETRTNSAAKENAIVDKSEGEGKHSRKSGRKSERMSKVLERFEALIK